MKTNDEKLENSNRRQTGLINKGIIRKTEEIYPDEIGLILASTNLLRRLTTVSKEAFNEVSAKPNLFAIMNLFARNREIVHFSTVCMMNGGYAPTKILLRAALENTLCMRLFRKKPDLAKTWLANPDKFRKKWKPQRIRDELFTRDSSLWNSYNYFYWRLCDYTHSSFRGWGELYYERSILWHPIFNEDYASECIGLIFFIIVHTLQQFSEIFRRWFKREMIDEINDIGKKDSGMIKRHFQVK